MTEEEEAETARIEQERQEALALKEAEIEETKARLEQDKQQVEEALLDREEQLKR